MATLHEALEQKKALDALENVAHLLEVVKRKAEMIQQASKTLNLAIIGIEGAADVEMTPESVQDLNKLVYEADMIAMNLVPELDKLSAEQVMNLEVAVSGIDSSAPSLVDKAEPENEEGGVPGGLNSVVVDLLKNGLLKNGFTSTGLAECGCFYCESRRSNKRAA